MWTWLAPASRRMPDTVAMSRRASAPGAFAPVSSSASLAIGILQICQEKLPTVATQ
jgi:hypothetical protein